MPDELIPGATTSHYVLTDVDVGRNVYCRVTATNVAGTAFANAVAVGPISPGITTPEAPSISIAPAILDLTPTVDEPLSSTQGIWAGDLPQTYSYQWHRVTIDAVDTTAPTITSSDTVNNTEGIVLAHALTASEFVTWAVVGGTDAAKFEISGSTLRWLGNGVKDFEAPDDADVNGVYAVQVRATDPSGNLTNQTINVTLVNAVDLPSVTTAPSITEPAPTEGDPMTCDPGVWAGGGTITFSYEWHSVTGAPVTGVSEPIGLLLALLKS